MDYKKLSDKEYIFMQKIWESQGINTEDLYDSVTHSHHLARRLEVGASRSMRLTAQVSTS